MKRYEVINALLQKRTPATYLEIGLARGENWFRVRAAHKIGIEPRDVFTSEKISWGRKLFFSFSRWRGAQIWAVTSDNYFNHLSAADLVPGRIDVAFIDGWHSYDQSLKDVLNCLTWLDRAGVIVLHDCNPESAAAAAPTPQEALALSEGKSGWNGDVWKTIVHLRSLRRDLSVCVLDCDEGLGIISFGAPENVLDYTADQIAELTYDTLQRERRSLLNLKSPAAYLRPAAH